MFTGNVLFALGLTFLAGLSTGIGSLLAFFSKKFNPKFLSAALGLSAGVMIYVSFVEIFPKAQEALSAYYGPKTGHWYTLIAFFAGIALIAIIDLLVPSHENPHEIKNMDIENVKDDLPDDKKLLRMGIFSAIAIAIHNFPEGLATFMAAMKEPSLGISIAIAIAIHNIPEGVAVSVPIYFATKSRKKAFWYSFLSGMAEPVGAIIGFILLRSVISNPATGDAAFGMVFAAVAGIMVYISFDELLPTAEEYGEHHIAIGGLIAGMVIMGVSLALF